LKSTRLERTRRHKAERKRGELLTDAIADAARVQRPKSKVLFVTGYAETAAGKSLS
jgi:hypothetical protein